MAEYQTPEEFERQLERMAEQLREGWITAKEYNQAVKDARVGIRGYTAQMEEGLKKLKMSTLALGKDMLSGKQGVEMFGGTIEAGAEQVANYAQKFGPAGKALGGFTVAVSKFVTASLKQSDQIYQSFQRISQTGTVGAGAMTEVYDNMKRFGYTVEQLGNLGDLLARNSKDFGVFFASALQGSRVFTEVADQIQNSPLRQQLFNLGLTVDDINDGIAGYINLQGKLGRVQSMSTEQLRAGAEQYIKELDTLTKLTGMSRKEQEDAREQALQIRQFYAGLADLEPEQAEQALQAFTMAYAKGGPEMAADMAANFNGVITNAGKMFMATGGKSMELFSAEFFKRGGTAAQAFAGVGESISPEFIEATKNMNKFNADMGSFDLRQLQMFKGGADAEKFQKMMAGLSDETYKMLTGTDRVTAAQSKTRDNQIKTTQNLQDFVNLGVKPATAAMELLTEVVEKLTDLLPGAGAARKRREEAAAIKRGELTTTQKMQTAGQTAAGMLNYDYGAGVPEDYMSRLVMAESGGRNIGNLEGTSSAFGLAQITEGTFKGLVSKAGAENPLYGKTFDDMKADVNLQMEAARQLTDQNRQFLASKNLPTTDAALYLAHFLGPGGASKALSASPADSISTVVSPQQLEANAVLRNMTTVAELKDWANNKIKGSGYQYGGVVSGPKSGYQATLHGTEAVVPLSNGRSIPVEVRNQDDTVLSAQLDKLDELIRIMQNQVSVSTKILQATA